MSALPISERKAKAMTNFNCNFQRSKRSFMTLTFDDVDENGKEIERKIPISTPKKKVYDALFELQDAVEEEIDEDDKRAENEKNRKLLDQMYDLATHILSNNLKREKITREWVEEQLGMDDLKTLLREYMAFAKGETSSPN